jgi:hypothetical protein
VNSEQKHSGANMGIELSYVRPQITLVVGLAVALSGCGGSSTRSTLTQSQAQAVSQQVEQAVVESLDTAFGASRQPVRQSRRSLAAAVGGIHPEASSTCTLNGNTEICNVSATVNCSGGGTIAVSGDFTGTFSSDSGTLDSDITLTPTNCAVTGTGLTLNGDPNVMLGGQFVYTDSGPTFPLTLTETGGISYGPNPSGSCKVNVTYSVNSLTSCTITGTICGQSVNGNC